MNDKFKVVLYCQIGKSLDMAKFSIDSAIKNSGLKFKEDFNLIFICWKTSDEVYNWLKDNSFDYVDMEYDEGKGFLWNLYKGWNLGYEVGFKYTNFVCPIATDHAFYNNWLGNLLKSGKENRIVNCKLIEPGTLPSLHHTENLGLTIEGEFNYSRFQELCKKLYNNGKDVLIIDEKSYGRRLDAMPFLCSKDVWERFGPMNKTLNERGITGDTDFFDRCKVGSVEITKSLDAISYHCGGIETQRNISQNVYT